MTGGGAAQPRACVGCRGADGTPLIQRGGRGSRSREPAMEKHVRPAARPRPRSYKQERTPACSAGCPRHPKFVLTSFPSPVLSGKYCTRPRPVS